MQDRLMQDLKEALKNKQRLRKDTITLLRSAIKQIEVDERRELQEPEILQIIQKQIGQKQKAIEEFERGNRADLVSEALDEIDVLRSYLPEPLSEEELKAAIHALVEREGATSMKDMGRLMAIAASEWGGRADRGKISALLKDNLSQMK